jgi:hypothetical protein
LALDVAVIVILEEDILATGTTVVNVITLTLDEVH